MSFMSIAYCTPHVLVCVLYLLQAMYSFYYCLLLDRCSAADHESPGLDRTQNLAAGARIQPLFISKSDLYFVTVCIAYIQQVDLKYKYTVYTPSPEERSRVLKR